MACTPQITPADTSQCLVWVYSTLITMQTTSPHVGMDTGVAIVRVGGRVGGIDESRKGEIFGEVVKGESGGLPCTDRKV